MLMKNRTTLMHAGSSGALVQLVARTLTATYGLAALSNSGLEK
jgi:hypothetical protein